MVFYSRWLFMGQLKVRACVQRLEFLGDAVLDYILTYYFYRKYPNCTPALLTNLRKASVNNCCYAHAAVKAGLHKHILHSSSKQMVNDLENSGRSFSGPSHGWEAGISLPEVCLFLNVQHFLVLLKTHVSCILSP
jgi:hypothetical protein